jgi:hypothetical protein
VLGFIVRFKSENGPKLTQWKSYWFFTYGEAQSDPSVISEMFL